MYELLIAEMRSQPWAILPEKLATIAELMAFRATGQRYTPEEIQARIGVAAAANRSVTRAPGMVAVLPITGVLQNRAPAMLESSGVVGVNKLQATFRALVNDPEIKAIVLDVNSPGGSVYGIAEFAQAIAESRETKPIVAVANHLAASAALHIASAAGEFYVSPSAQVGSVGVLQMHQDVSVMAENEGVKTTFIHSGKYKVEGNPFEPLSDEARAHMQAECDKFYAMFVGDLARFRGVSRAHVESNFGQGRVLTAKDAVAAGMADGVRSLEQVLAKFGAGSAPARAGMRAEYEMTMPGEGSMSATTQEVRAWTPEQAEAAADAMEALAASSRGVAEKMGQFAEAGRELAEAKDERDPEHVRRARELALAKARYS